MEGAVDRKVHKEIEERMGVLQTTLKKAEASIAESEDHLKESRIREEETHQEDRGQSDSSEEQDGNVMVEGAEESGPGPLRSQEAEPSMEVDVDDIPPLTSGDATTVTAEEDKMLTGDTTSMSGEMARLEVSSPDNHKPEDGETPQ